MIYTTEENRYLSYNTPLIEYIKSKHLYTNENLIYTKKYSDGTFSITNPTETFTNCEFINGYPHFQIPLSKCIEEIEFFMNDGKICKAEEGSDILFAKIEWPNIECTDILGKWYVYTER